MAHKWTCEEHDFNTGSGYAWGLHKRNLHGGQDPRKPASGDTPAPSTGKPNASSVRRSSSGSIRSGRRGDQLVKAMLAEASAQREVATKATGLAERLEKMASELSTE